MQVFEFYFNPKLRPDRIFESFCYEPENIYEKRVGNLFMVGVLKNALPQNAHFLNQLSRIIKDKYYSPTVKSSEKSFRESLKRVNHFLEDKTKTGDVSWLGNLSFVVLSLKNFSLNFAKVGDLKIFLLRDGKAVDIDQKVQIEEIEPYPLKVFLNIISGKLAEDDVVLILSKDIAEFFQKENLLDAITKMIPFEEKKLRKILNDKKEDILRISGLCLLIHLTKEKPETKKETVFAPSETREFSFKKALSPLFSFFSAKKLPKVSLPGKDLFKLPKIRAPKISFPKLKIFQIVVSKVATIREKVQALVRNKNIILVLSLAFLLIVGFFVFQKEREAKLKEYQNQLTLIEEQIDQAESFLFVKTPQSSKQAEIILRESWDTIHPLREIAYTLSQNLQNQIFALEEKIEIKLYQLNNMVVIQEPELVFELNVPEFTPRQMLYDGENFYFFNPFLANLLKVNQEGETEIIPTDQKFKDAILFDQETLFLSKSNSITVLENSEIKKTFSLQSPYPDFDFVGFATFKLNLYFLDNKSGQIVKYSHLNNLNWDLPTLWLEPETQRAFGANSIAIDGAVWILNQSSIDKYYGGEFQESLSLDFFPYPNNFLKIHANFFLPHLYVLDPEGSRVIVLDKSGALIQQFKSEKFDNLFDFAISSDGNIIYLLNGSKVYQIEL